ncbi:MAG: hypothetical protein GY715_09910 [Planctomycetes bacterium]|nr:hypothetical protein [Planctomycetota bacterium]
MRSRNPMTVTRSLGVGIAVPVLITSALAGPVWEEGTATGNDAGSKPDEAETTTGTGEVTRIRGDLGGSADGIPDFEDMYLIRICDPNAFFASTAPPEGGFTDFDTRLWLFRPGPIEFEAFGFVGNDNRPGPPTVGSLINGDPVDGSPPLTEPGLYYLAVSGAQRDPRSAPGPQGEIFFLATPTEISGPDGPGGDDPIVGWETIDPPPAFGHYEIALAGVAFGSTEDVDCNQNQRADVCDIIIGSSRDLNENGIPDECEPPEDLDGDGDVDFGDILVLISMWGPCPPLPEPCPADLNGNGIVDFGDILLIIGAWSG